MKYICTVNIYINMGILKWDENIPMLTFIKGLHVGDLAEFPISKSSMNVRATLSIINLTMGRKYSSHINREKNTVEIARKK